MISVEPNPYFPVLGFSILPIRLTVVVYKFLIIGLVDVCPLSLLETTFTLILGMPEVSVSLTSCDLSSSQLTHLKM